MKAIEFLQALEDLQKFSTCAKFTVHLIFQNSGFVSGTIQDKESKEVYACASDNYESVVIALVRHITVMKELKNELFTFKN